MRKRISGTTGKNKQGECGDWREQRPEGQECCCKKKSRAIGGIREMPEKYLSTDTAFPGTWGFKDDVKENLRRKNSERKRGEKSTMEEDVGSGKTGVRARSPEKSLGHNDNDRKLHEVQARKKRGDSYGIPKGPPFKQRMTQSVRRRKERKQQDSKGNAKNKKKSRMEAHSKRRSVSQRWEREQTVT